MPNFTDKVARYSGFNFTKGQEEALDKLEKWYRDPKDLFFTLSGRAGTGKTYILKYFVDQIVTNPICVTAPTHKAVRQVERSTNRKGKTLQSLHGLRPNFNLEDFDLNNINFDALGTPTMNNYKLVIIDECSMVTPSLHELNAKRAKDLGVKILYVGDAKQLPPVTRGDKIELTESPTFNIPNYYELSEIVRQDSDNPIGVLLEILVHDISTDGHEFLHYLLKNPHKLNDNNEGYIVYNNHTDFINSAVNDFKHENFSNDPDYARVAAWKNQTVLNSNLAIRNRLIPYFSGPDANKELIDLNDLLIGYKTITDEFNETVLINSEDYVIEEVIPRTADGGFKAYAVKISPRHGGTSVNINIVDYRDKSFMVFYEHIRQKYFNALYAPGRARSEKWKEYFQYKNSYMTLIDFPIKEGEVNKVYVSKDIDYAFALTVHKLQGSTIQNTYVDLNDMLFYSNGRAVMNSNFSPNAIQIRNKLVYTALSRTSKIAHIYLNIKG